MHIFTINALYFSHYIKKKKIGLYKVIFVLIIYKKMLRGSAKIFHFETGITSSSDSDYEVRTSFLRGSENF